MRMGLWSGNRCARRASSAFINLGHATCRAASVDLFDAIHSLGVFMAINDERSPHLANTTRARSRMNALDWLALALMIIGGINWGLVGLLNIDFVAMLFGSMSVLSRIVYCLVGLAALYGIVLAVRQSSANDAVVP
jgi:uncharacterized protein